MVMYCIFDDNDKYSDCKFMFALLIILLPFQYHVVFLCLVLLCMAYIL